MGLSQRCVKNRQARGREKSVIEGMLMDVVFVPLAYAYARTNRRFIFFAVTSVTGLYVSYYDTVFYYVLMDEF